MKAIIQHEYGMPETLEFGDVETPTVRDDEILVAVRASSVNPLDWHTVTGAPYLVRIQAGWRRPKQAVAGSDMAGQVAAVGRAVTRFKAGDEVFGLCTGTFAEYVRIREARAVPKPAGVTFEQAAAVPVAGLTALQGLRAGRIQAGQQVLINGAAGGVGTFAVQLAKHWGADVTAVCGTRNVEIVRSLGADHVVDYTCEDYTNGETRYDLILDMMGNHSLSASRRVLAPRGTLVLISGPKTNRWFGPLGQLVRALVVSRFFSQRMVGILARNNVDDLAFLVGLIADRSVTPAIGRTFPLREVPDALGLLGAGHAQGKIVVTM